MTLPKVLPDDLIDSLLTNYKKCSGQLKLENSIDMID